MKRFGSAAAMLVVACGGAAPKASTAPAPAPASAPAPAPAPAAASPAVASASVPLARIQAMITTHCLDCHDPSNKSLDLTTPLALGDERTDRMLSAVSSYRMPPSSQPVESKSDIKELYPMSEPDRAQLADDLLKLLEATPDEGKQTPSFSEDERFQSMISVAAPLVSAAELQESIAVLGAQGFGSGFGRQRQSPHSTGKLRLLAHRLCRGMVRELDKKAATAAGKDVRVAALLEVLYGTKPAPPAVAESVAMMNGFEGLVDPPDTPMVALCTTHLSGPRFGFSTISHPAKKGSK